MNKEPNKVLMYESMQLRNAIGLGCWNIGVKFRQLQLQGWKLFVVDQRCGRCYYAPKKWLTIPVWALRKEFAAPGYWIWYVSHEMAHAFAGRNADHGSRFMHELRVICPPEFIHYELDYKVRNASQAGISKMVVERKEQVWEVDFLDLL